MSHDITGKHQFAMMNENHDTLRQEQMQVRSRRTTLEEEQAKK